MNIISGIVLVFQKKEKTIHHTMVSFDEIRFAKKIRTLRKIIAKIADYYLIFGNQTFKEYCEKINSKLEAILGELEQKRLINLI